MTGGIGRERRCGRYRPGHALHLPPLALATIPRRRYGIIRCQRTMNPNAGVGRSTAMDIRKTVTLVEEINSEYGAPAPARCDASRLPRCSRTRSPEAAGRRPQTSDRIFARARGFAHQDGTGNTRREPRAAARLHQGGAGRHRRRPRTWRCDDTSETRHGDAPRDQTRSRYHSGPRQGGPAGHDRRSDLWAPRRGVGSRMPSIRPRC